MKPLPAKFNVLPVVALFAGLAAMQAEPPTAPVQVTPQNTALYFSPNGGCTQAIVEELEKARKSIFVQAYTFTSPPIAKALVEAKRRGVKVEVILDKINLIQNSSAVDLIAQSGIPTLVDAEHPLAHNKVMVIDGETVITGSFNFSAAAEEHNADNLLVIHEKEFAKKYWENWHAHRDHSKPYETK